METHQIVKLPFEPIDVLYSALLQGLNVACTIIVGLPWPLKLLLVIMVYVRITRGKGKTRRS